MSATRKAYARPAGVLVALHAVDRVRLAALSGSLDEAEQLLGRVDEPAGDDANLLLSYFEVSAELAMWQRRPDVAEKVLDRAVEVFEATDNAWLLPLVLAWAAAAIADASGAEPDDGAIDTFHDRVGDQQKSEAELPPAQRPWVRVAQAELSRLQGTLAPHCGTRPRRPGTR